MLAIVVIGAVAIGIDGFALKAVDLDLAFVMIFVLPLHPTADPNDAVVQMKNFGCNNFLFVEKFLPFFDNSGRKILSELSEIQHRFYLLIGVVAKLDLGSKGNFATTSIFVELRAQFIC
jgi:hypothetical protein